MLTVAPDGHLMQIPVEKLNGAFPNFYIPGLILTGMSLLTCCAFIAVFLKSKIDWVLTSVALIGFTIWFAVEIAILRELHPLQIIWGTPILIGYWVATPVVHPKNIRTTKS